MIKTIVLASNNKNKLLEFQKILEPYNYIVKSQSQMGVNIEVEETGTTYKENAYLKAKAIYELTNLPVVSDDSGLEVDFLDKKPGVMSSRFLGETATDKEKRQYILEKLKSVEKEKRTARFVCCICYIDENGETHFFEEKCEGFISEKEIGDNGFGYDPIFEYNGRTFAQMSKSEKNDVSHRGKAFNKFLNYIETINVGNK